MMDRRAVLATGAAALLATPARAAGQVIIGTWGGDYAELLAQNIDRPLVEPGGTEVLQQVADAPPQSQARHRARRPPRRGRCRRPLGRRYVRAGPARPVRHLAGRFHSQPAERAGAAAPRLRHRLSVMWLARGYKWRRAGVPVRHVVPSEGATPIVFEAAIPKNAQNKANAAAYLNAMLDPRAQAGFAERMGYVPTVSNAQLPAELAAQIAFTPEQQAAFRPPNYEYVARSNSALLDFWNREFKG